MLSLCIFLEELRDNNNHPIKNEPYNNHRNAQSFTATNAQKIIEANRKEPESKAVVNINPKSVSDVLSRNSGSAQKSANNYTNNSLNAGQRASSLTNGYINKPQRVPGRLGVNPTFDVKSI